MLIPAKHLNQTPVMSLQTGAEIAQTGEAIIDPGVLEVVAYRLNGPRIKGASTLLLTNDIREISDIGFIVDSSDELVEEPDILKLQKLARLNFHLNGLDVFDDTKNRLGKIDDYGIDPMTFTIHQLYVKRPLLKSLQTSDLIISRKQIIEVNNKAIIVRSASLEEKPVPAAVTGNFVNPFRGTTSRPANNSDTTSM